MIEKLTLVELLVVCCFGIACFWVPAPRSAERTSSFAILAQTSSRLDGLRRSRWQWLTMLGTMLVLRMQRQSPPLLEVTVGLMFAVLLASPVYQLMRVGNSRN